MQSSIRKEKEMQTEMDYAKNCIYYDIYQALFHVDAIMIHFVFKKIQAIRLLDVASSD